MSRGLCETWDFHLVRTSIQTAGGLGATGPLLFFDLPLHQPPQRRIDTGLIPSPVPAEPRQHVRIQPQLRWPDFVGFYARESLIFKVENTPRELILKRYRQTFFCIPGTTRFETALRDRTSS
jgi:hypothetical protein